MLPTDFKMFIKEGQPDYDKLVKTSSLPTTPISKSKFLGSFGKSIQGKGTKSEDSSLITFIRSPRISWQKERNNDDGGLTKSGRLERKQGVKRELLELPEITVSLTGSKNDGNFLISATVFVQFKGGGVPGSGLKFSKHIF